MIKVTRKYLFSGGVEIRMQGHADAPRNAENHDLVCAAASILCPTLAEVFKRYCTRPVISMEPGDALLRGTPRSLCAADFRAAYEAVLSGFELLAGSYPEYIEVSEWL